MNLFSAGAVTVLGAPGSCPALRPVTSAPDRRQASARMSDTRNHIRNISTSLTDNPGRPALEEVPSTEFTRSNPTLALLALMAHGRNFTTPEPPAKMLRGLWESDLYQGLENKQQRIYYDRAMQTLPLWIAQALTKDPMTQEYFSPIVLNYVEQGREEGMEAGLRKSILLLLDSRGYTPSEDELQRIENEHNKSVLEGWVKTAANLVPGRAFLDEH